MPPGAANDRAQLTTGISVGLASQRESARNQFQNRGLANQVRCRIGGNGAAGA